MQGSMAKERSSYLDRCTTLDRQLRLSSGGIHPGRPTNRLDDKPYYRR